MIPIPQSLFTLPIIPLLLFIILTEASSSWGLHGEGKKDMKLFVFGDSYVDTGNFKKSGSYMPPNGMTFPGKPSGRFSDGRVLTDYIASYLGIRTPLPYIYRNYVEKSKLENGMNYACGGTGILNTLFTDGPNLTTQIHSLQKQVQQNFYTKHDLRSSVALVNVGGNDFATFLQSNGALKDAGAFSSRLISQLCSDLKLIKSLGVRKVAITLIMPMGCLPQQSVNTSYRKCAEIPNEIAINHNKKLLHCISKLNFQSPKPVFVTLNLYNTFLSVITSTQRRRAKDPSLMNPLKACVNVEVDKEGELKYNVCEKPQVSFFWDQVHPSQNGWHQVYIRLKSSLRQLLQ
ncbi:GDSL esterase/lipase At5g03610-like [Prosopis cineraria]|uniref:GDSL esterase/lipase At5g03610-like n=1 Tax=Prosopis cineraria TaxID=364024 RepID=UPI0024105A9E|nr:GDSL esterase/lipase At5g03610-like [Prosopis cineraria]